MNEVDVIRGARGILSDPARWGTGAFMSTYQGVESYCMAGALMAAAGNLPILTLGRAPLTSGALFVKARYLVEAHLPEPYSSVPLFNDAPTTTHQDVLDVLDKTLADLGGLA